MLRRFREHDLRPVQDLRGVWDFAFLGDVDPREVDARAIDFHDRMAVPGCFDATPAYAGKRGLAAYRAHVPLFSTPRHRLVLDGLHHWGRVFVNGESLRDHVGGFTRFHADFPTPGGDEVEVIVLADNRFDYQRCPLHLEYFDWYHYGGIARGVELHGIPDPALDRLRVVTEKLSPPTVALTIHSLAETPGRAELLVALDGDEVHRGEVALEQPAGEIQLTLEAPGAALWSPEEPNLHLLHVRLGDDDLRERIGIRQVRAENRQIVLNRKPIRLLGFGRHEFHPEIGHGLPDALLVADAQILRDVGANFVRGAHYPQDARWLDLCDEMGILVWSEGIAWQHTAEHLADRHFLDAQLAHLDEMVASAANHPSVIIWGTLNECDSHDPACRPGYEAMLGRLRELDGSRLVTYACDRPFRDMCLDLVDLVSVNCYPGWYHGGLEDIAPHLDRIAAHLDAHGQSEKPFMISEIGAGGIWGVRDWNRDLWTEQYQSEALQRALKHLLQDSERWSGVSIWQFCDVRSSDAKTRILGRPRAFNNKGVVDEYRRPKPVYEVVRRHFHPARGV